MKSKITSICPTFQHSLPQNPTEFKFSYDFLLVAGRPQFPAPLKLRPYGAIQIWLLLLLLLLIIIFRHKSMSITKQQQHHSDIFSSFSSANTSKNRKKQDRTPNYYGTLTWFNTMWPWHRQTAISSSILIRGGFNTNGRSFFLPY